MKNRRCSVFLPRMEDPNERHEKGSLDVLADRAQRHTVDKSKARWDKKSLYILDPRILQSMVLSHNGDPNMHRPRSIRLLLGTEECMAQYRKCRRNSHCRTVDSHLEYSPMIGDPKAYFAK